MHYFIARGILERLGLEPSIVPQIRIEMLDRDQVHNNLILVGELVFLRGYTMVVDLTIMDMPNFIMILGMNFLGRYDAEIDCRKKKAKFSMDDGK